MQPLLFSDSKKKRVSLSSYKFIRWMLTQHGLIINFIFFFVIIYSSFPVNEVLIPIEP